MMKWGILIATVTERARFFNLLVSEFQRQINYHGLQDEIVLISKCDNKEISIGSKRQLLLEEAKRQKCTYINFFDDDDWPGPTYIHNIYQAILLKPDCVGILINMTTNGIKPQTCCHSLKYPEWSNRVDGYDYVRNVTHFNPVKLSLALKAGFTDKRFGEDREYSDKLTPLCKREIFIPFPIMNYRFTTHQNHAQKYGV